MQALLYHNRRVRHVTMRHKVTSPSQSHDRQYWQDDSEARQIHEPESLRGKSKVMPSLLEIGFEDTIGNQ
jgi:hypothetical protein